MSTSILKAKLLRNLGANAYGQLITVGIQIFSIPIFIHYWGIELYGEWLILSAIPAYLSLSDIGFSSVAANDMTMRMAKGDRKGVLGVYQSIFVITCLSWILIGCLAVGAILSVPIDKIFSLSHISSADATIILVVFVIYMFLGAQGGVLSAGLRATDRYAYSTMVNNTMRLSEWFASILVLILGGSVLQVVCSAFIVKVLGSIALWFTLRKHTPWLSLGFSAATKSKIRELFKPAFAFMAFPVGTAVSLQGTVLVIGMLLGPTSVAIFTAYRTVARVLVQVIAMINYAIWPEISTAYGAGNLDLATRLHRKGSSFAFWIAVVGVLIIGSIGEYFIGIWTRHSFQPNHFVLGFLLLTTFLNALWQTSCVVLMATNMHKTISVAFMASAMSGVAISLAIIPLVGIGGAGVALAIAEVPMMYLTISRGLSLLGDNWTEYVRNVLRNPFNFK